MTSRTKKKKKPSTRTQKTASKKTASKKTASKKTASKKTASKKTASKKTARAPEPRLPPKQRIAPTKVAPRKAEPVRRRPTGAASGTDRAIGSITELPLPPPDWLRIDGAGAEKRRYERVRHDLPVRLYAGEEQKSYLEARLRSVDLSLSGIFLRSTFFLPADIPVKVEFDAPWGTTATIFGRVARVDTEGTDAGFAIRFDRLDQESLKDLVCLFAGEHVERFVKTFVRTRSGGAEGAGDDQAALLWEGIVAWELERLQLKVEDHPRR